MSFWPDLISNNGHDDDHEKGGKDRIAKYVLKNLHSLDLIFWQSMEIQRGKFTLSMYFF